MTNPSDTAKLVLRLEEMADAPYHHADDRRTWRRAAEAIADLEARLEAAERELDEARVERGVFATAAAQRLDMVKRLKRELDEARDRLETIAGLIEEDIGDADVRAAYLVATGKATADGTLATDEGEGDGG